MPVDEVADSAGEDEHEDERDDHGSDHYAKLTGHPKATRAYAWSAPVEAGNKRGFVAVLDIPPIMSPVDAVRSVIAQESRAD